MPLPTPALPIVGQPCRAHGVLVIAPITCNCRADNGPMMIRGFDEGQRCSHCGKVFFIKRLAFDRAKQQVSMEIGADAPTLGQAPSDPTKDT